MTKKLTEVLEAAEELTYETSADKLKSQGVFYITSQIDEEYIEEIQTDMLWMHRDPNWSHLDQVELFVNSVGGSCSTAWAMVDLIKAMKYPVRTTGIGLCHSAGAVLLASGTRGLRTATKNCEIMIHTAHLNAELSRATLTKITDIQRSMRLEFERDVRFWIEHSKYRTREEVIDNLLDDRDHWMTVYDALDHGIIDEIVR